MADRYALLTDQQQALVWISLASVLVGAASVLIQAQVKGPVRLGSSLAFHTAFVVVFGRIGYRLLHGGPIGWGAVVIYAAPGVAAAWGLVDSLRYQQLVSKEVKARIAYIAAGEAEKAADLLRIAADELRVQALERTAANTERTAIATEAIAEQGKQNGG